MYTVSVPEGRAWLLDPTQPTVAPLRCGTRRQSDAAETLSGEVRQFAGGTSQLVTEVTDIETIPITFVALTVAQRIQILEWRGQLLLLRTVDGDRLFGGYLAVNTHRYYRAASNGTTLYDLGVTFTTVSYSEAV